MTQVVKPNWDEYALATDSSYPSEMLIRFYNKHLNAFHNPAVLEIGCGVGRNTVFLATKTSQLSAVDISPVAVSKTEAKLAKEGLVADLDCLNFSTAPIGKYDAIVDISCLQHLQFSHFSSAVRKVYESLNDGGYFFSICKHPNDYVYNKGTYLSENERVYEDTLDKITNPCLITFILKSQLQEVFGIFDELEINTDTWTYDNGSKNNSHWVITGRKL